MNHPQKCDPHYCAFNSPACPEKCSSHCKRIKPNCVSVTAQEALNIPELKVPRTKTGIPLVGISTRERVFGIPYDPRKDLDIPVPPEVIDQYLKHNYESLPDGSLKEYVKGICCQCECKCPMGVYCMCRKRNRKCVHNQNEQNS